MRTLLEARKGMCLDIAEQLEAHFGLRPFPRWDVNEAAELIDSRLPDTYDEAELRAKETDDAIADLRPQPQKPSVMDKLRAALGHTKDIDLRSTLLDAVGMVRQRNALLAACEAVAALRDCEDAADWKDAFGRLTGVCASAVAAAKGGQS